MGHLRIKVIYQKSPGGQIQQLNLNLFSRFIHIPGQFIQGKFFRFAFVREKFNQVQRVNLIESLEFFIAMLGVITA